MDFHITADELVAEYDRVVFEGSVIEAAYNTAVADATAAGANLLAAQNDLTATVDQLRLARAEVARLNTLLGPVPLNGGFNVRNASITSAYPPNIEFTWRELNPSLGVFDGRRLEAALATGLPFSVRPMLGQFAPDWAMSKAGTYTYVEPQGGAQVRMIRQWTDPAIAATAELMAWMTQYDGDIPFVWASGGMTFYAEPMQRGFSSDTTRINAKAAGYTREADLAALRAGIDAMAGFKRTRVGQAYNPLQVITDTGGFDTDMAASAGLMDYLRTKVGPQSVLGNCSLRSSFLDPAGVNGLKRNANGGVYDAILARGRAFRFQTAMASLVGDLPAVCAWAAKVGAYIVELPAGYGALLTATQLATFDAALKANVA